MTSPFDVARHSPWPRIRATVLAVIFVGGCAGGLVRYVVTRAWPTPTDAFPWSTFAVNVAGAFILALLLVLVSDVARPSAYLRPLIGTGFCGALTTFSSIVVSVDELVAHGRVVTAVGYVVTTLACGLAAGMLGVVTGRAYGAYRRRMREAGSG